MKSIPVLFAAAFSLAAAGAWAHGDEKRPSKPMAKKALSSEEHAFGKEGDPKNAKRTIRVAMSDKYRFTPDEIVVNQGDTVKFVVANEGQILHEMVIGTEEELVKHAELMRKFPGMEHEEPYMAHVKAGGKTEMAWHFTKAGTFAYGCLIPGHYEAGMKGRIVVVSRK